jgi:hypothetical protein
MSGDESWRTKQVERADAELARLGDANRERLVVEEEPEWLIGTNLVKFGVFDGQPAVLKYFDWWPRKEHEEKALLLFAHTGLVPKLYPVESDSALVMERLRGSTLDLAEQNLGQESVRRLYHQLGQAIARITEVAPGGPSGGWRDLSARPGFDYQFYCQADLRALFDTVTERAGKILAEQDVPDRVLLRTSLAALRDNREAILAYPSFLQMDDFHTCNIMADGIELTGFIDLEMTRYGNEVLLLASALAMMMEGPPARWAWIRRGYEDRRGRPIDSDLLSLARIAAAFSQWIRFMWYWTGDPSEFERGARSSPVRDIKAAAETIQGMQL